MSEIKTVRQFCYTILAILFISGCASNDTITNTVQAEKKTIITSSPSFIVSSKATFSWHPNIISSATKVKKTTATIDIENQVQQAIQESLIKKGYSFVSATASWPDYFVGYVYVTEPVIDDDVVSKYFDLMPGLRPKSDINRRYEKDTLIIDFIEPTAFRVLRRASTPELVDGVELTSDSVLPERIESKVDDLLRGFPK
ncbi:hypothetical protein MNBD_GAMMA21-2734 [hydrothermal vent metagenome]|uniref:DUF4136 domain-containing protein n=1 Tax=hydrothermal vent metagenome TaxID=652676 RepID=A0A3B1A0Q0_9ZZZZ